MITIEDPGQTLSPAQRDALTAKAHAYPFDIHVLIGTGSGAISETRASFEQEVAAYVKPGSRMVSIGVEPVKHFTFVRSSAALNVPPGPQVAQAGNAFFKRGNLVDGIDAIAAKANDLRTEPVALAAPKPGPDTRVIHSQTGFPIVINEHHTSAGVWWGVGIFVLAAAGVVGWFVWRARKRDRDLAAAQAELELEASDLRARNLEEQAWHDAMAEKQAPLSVPAGGYGSYRPSSVARRVSATETLAQRYPAPSPLRASTPVAMPAQAPTPAQVTLVAPNNSNIDTLLAYELGRESARPYREPVIVEREVVVERERESTSRSFWPSSENSSSSSLSSDSSSSSSSSDSSSSSSFDSGSDTSSGSDW